MANIKVAVRVRPLCKKEIENGDSVIVDVSDTFLTIKNAKLELRGGTVADSRERKKTFAFDSCYDSMEETSGCQELVFQDLGLDILQSAFDGFDACLFAYGQTGTGKTFTMMGTNENPGLTPRICEVLFSRVYDETLASADSDQTAVTYKVEASYYEIYNERVRDLLRSSGGKEKFSLKVREHPKTGPFVEDLSTFVVRDLNEIRKLIDKGNQRRITAATHMHAYSSRSHAIFQIKFSQASIVDGLPSEIVSRVNLVDLAGSERGSPNEVYTKERMKEGSNINRSLITLGNVITALAERGAISNNSPTDIDSIATASSSSGYMSSPARPQSQRPNNFIPYRDSVLTWLLRGSLGGSAKTVMVATISPSSSNYTESLSTLLYAQRAKAIVNLPSVNEDPNVRLIRELRQEIYRLREILSKTNLDSGPALQDTLSERLQCSEQMADKLTKCWIDKWFFYSDNKQEPVLCIRRPTSDRRGQAVLVESQLPHLVALDEDDVTGTGVLIYHLDESGRTVLGGDPNADIGLRGPGVSAECCAVQSINGRLTLIPLQSTGILLNGSSLSEPTVLCHGDLLVLGYTNVFRFNNPVEAARLRQSCAELSSISSVSTLSLDSAAAFLGPNNRTRYSHRQSAVFTSSTLTAGVAASSYSVFASTQSLNALCSRPSGISNRLALGKDCRHADSSLLIFPSEEQESAPIAGAACPSDLPESTAAVDKDLPAPLAWLHAARVVSSLSSRYPSASTAYLRRRALQRKQQSLGENLRRSRSCGSLDEVASKDSPIPVTNHRHPILATSACTCFSCSFIDILQEVAEDLEAAAEIMQQRPMLPPVPSFPSSASAAPAVIISQSMVELTTAPVTVSDAVNAPIAISRTNRSSSQHYCVPPRTVHSKGPSPQRPFTIGAPYPSSHSYSYSGSGSGGSHRSRMQPDGSTEPPDMAHVIFAKSLRNFPPVSPILPSTSPIPGASSQHAVLLPAMPQAGQNISGKRTPICGDIPQEPSCECCRPPPPKRSERRPVMLPAYDQPQRAKPSSRPASTVGTVAKIISTETEMMRGTTANSLRASATSEPGYLGASEAVTSTGAIFLPATSGTKRTRAQPNGPGRRSRPGSQSAVGDSGVVSVNVMADDSDKNQAMLGFTSRKRIGIRGGGSSQKRRAPRFGVFSLTVPLPSSHSAPRLYSASEMASSAIDGKNLVIDLEEIEDSLQQKQERKSSLKSQLAEPSSSSTSFSPYSVDLTSSSAQSTTWSTTASPQLPVAQPARGLHLPYVPLDVNSEGESDERLSSDTEGSFIGRHASSTASPNLRSAGRFSLPSGHPAPLPLPVSVNEQNLLNSGLVVMASSTTASLMPPSSIFSSVSDLNINRHPQPLSNSYPCPNTEESLLDDMVAAAVASISPRNSTFVADQDTSVYVSPISEKGIERPVSVTFRKRSSSNERHSTPSNVVTRGSHEFEVPSQVAASASQRGTTRSCSCVSCTSCSCSASYTNECTCSCCSPCLRSETHLSMATSHSSSTVLPAGDVHPSGAFDSADLQIAYADDVEEAMDPSENASRIPSHIFRAANIGKPVSDKVRSHHGLDRRAQSLPREGNSDDTLVPINRESRDGAFSVPPVDRHRVQLRELQDKCQLDASVPLSLNVPQEIGTTERVLVPGGFGHADQISTADTILSSTQPSTEVTGTVNIAARPFSDHPSAQSQLDVSEGHLHRTSAEDNSDPLLHLCRSVLTALENDENQNDFEVSLEYVRQQRRQQSPWTFLQPSDNSEVEATGISDMPADSNPSEEFNAQSLELANRPAVLVVLDRSVDLTSTAESVRNLCVESTGWKQLTSHEPSTARENVELFYPENENEKEPQIEAESLQSPIYVRHSGNFAEELEMDIPVGSETYTVVLPTAASSSLKIRRSSADAVTRDTNVSNLSTTAACDSSSKLSPSATSHDSFVPRILFTRRSQSADDTRAGKQPSDTNTLAAEEPSSIPVSGGLNVMRVRSTFSHQIAQDNPYGSAPLNVGPERITRSSTTVTTQQSEFPINFGSNHSSSNRIDRQGDNDHSRSRSGKQPYCQVRRSPSARRASSRELSGKQQDSADGGADQSVAHFVKHHRHSYTPSVAGAKLLPAYSKWRRSHSLDGNAIAQQRKVHESISEAQSYISHETVIQHPTINVSATPAPLTTATTTKVQMPKGSVVIRTSNESYVGRERDDRSDMSFSAVHAPSNISSNISAKSEIILPEDSSNSALPITESITVNVEITDCVDDSVSLPSSSLITSKINFAESIADKELTAMSPPAIIQLTQSPNERRRSSLSDVGAKDLEDMPQASFSEAVSPLIKHDEKPPIRHRRAVSAKLVYDDGGRRGASDSEWRRSLSADSNRLVQLAGRSGQPTGILSPPQREPDGALRLESYSYQDRDTESNDRVSVNQASSTANIYNQDISRSLSAEPKLKMHKHSLSADSSLLGTVESGYGTVQQRAYQAGLTSGASYDSSAVPSDSRFNSKQAISELQKMHFHPVAQKSSSSSIPTCTSENVFSGGSSAADVSKLRHAHSAVLPEMSPSATYFGSEASLQHDPFASSRRNVELKFGKEADSSTNSLAVSNNLLTFFENKSNEETHGPLADSTAEVQSGSSFNTRPQSPAQIKITGTPLQADSFCRSESAGGYSELVKGGLHLDVGVVQPDNSSTSACALDKERCIKASTAGAVSSPDSSPIPLSHDSHILTNLSHPSQQLSVELQQVGTPHVTSPITFSPGHLSGSQSHSTVPLGMIRSSSTSGVSPESHSSTGGGDFRSNSGSEIESLEIQRAVAFPQPSLLPSRQSDEFVSVPGSIQQILQDEHSATAFAAMPSSSESAMSEILPMSSSPHIASDLPPMFEPPTSSLPEFVRSSSYNSLLQSLSGSETTVRPIGRLLSSSSHGLSSPSYKPFRTSSLSGRTEPSDRSIESTNLEFSNTAAEKGPHVVYLSGVNEPSLESSYRELLEQSPVRMEFLPSEVSTYPLSEQTLVSDFKEALHERMAELVRIGLKAGGSTEPSRTHSSLLPSEQKGMEDRPSKSVMHRSHSADTHTDNLASTSISNMPSSIRQSTAFEYKVPSSSVQGAREITEHGKRISDSSQKSARAVDVVMHRKSLSSSALTQLPTLQHDLPGSFGHLPMSADFKGSDINAVVDLCAPDNKYTQRASQRSSIENLVQNTSLSQRSASFELGSPEAQGFLADALPPLLPPPPGFQGGGDISAEEMVSSPSDISLTSVVRSPQCPDERAMAAVVFSNRFASDEAGISSAQGAGQSPSHQIDDLEEANRAEVAFTSDSIGRLLEEARIDEDSIYQTGGKSPVRSAPSGLEPMGTEIASQSMVTQAAALQERAKQEQLLMLMLGMPKQLRGGGSSSHITRAVSSRSPEVTPVQQFRSKSAEAAKRGSANAPSSLRSSSSERLPRALPGQLHDSSQQLGVGGITGIDVKYSPVDASRTSPIPVSFSSFRRPESPASAMVVATNDSPHATAFGVTTDSTIAHYDQGTAVFHGEEDDEERNNLFDSAVVPILAEDFFKREIGAVTAESLIQRVMSSNRQLESIGLSAGLSRHVAEGGSTSPSQFPEASEEKMPQHPDSLVQQVAQNTLLSAREPDADKDLDTCWDWLQNQIAVNEPVSKSGSSQPFQSDPSSPQLAGEHVRTALKPPRPPSTCLVPPAGFRNPPLAASVAQMNTTNAVIGDIVVDNSCEVTHVPRDVAARRSQLNAEFMSLLMEASVTICALALAGVASSGPETTGTESVSRGASSQSEQNPLPTSITALMRTVTPRPIRFSPVVQLVATNSIIASEDAIEDVEQDEQVAGESPVDLTSSDQETQHSLGVHAAFPSLFSDVPRRQSSPVRQYQQEQDVATVQVATMPSGEIVTDNLHTSEQVPLPYEYPVSGQPATPTIPLSRCSDAYASNTFPLILSSSTSLSLSITDVSTSQELLPTITDSYIDILSVPPRHGAASAEQAVTEPLHELRLTQHYQSGLNIHSTSSPLPGLSAQLPVDSALPSALKPRQTASHSVKSTSSGTEDARSLHSIGVGTESLPGSRCRAIETDAQVVRTKAVGTEMSLPSATISQASGIDEDITMYQRFVDASTGPDPKISSSFENKTPPPPPPHNVDVGLGTADSPRFWQSSSAPGVWPDALMRLYEQYASGAVQPPPSFETTPRARPRGRRFSSSSSGEGDATGSHKPGTDRQLSQRRARSQGEQNEQRPPTSAVRTPSEDSITFVFMEHPGTAGSSALDASEERKFAKHATLEFSEPIGSENTLPRDTCEQATSPFIGSFMSRGISPGELRSDSLGDSKLSQDVIPAPDMGNVVLSQGYSSGLWATTAVQTELVEEGMRLMQSGALSLASATATPIWSSMAVQTDISDEERREHRKRIDELLESVEHPPRIRRVRSLDSRLTFLGDDGLDHEVSAVASSNTTGFQAVAEHNRADRKETGTSASPPVPPPPDFADEGTATDNDVVNKDAETASASTMTEPSSSVTTTPPQAQPVPTVVRRSPKVVEVPLPPPLPPVNIASNAREALGAKLSPGSRRRLMQLLGYPAPSEQDDTSHSRRSFNLEPVEGVPKVAINTVSPKIKPLRMGRLYTMQADRDLKIEAFKFERQRELSLLSADEKRAIIDAGTEAVTGTSSPATSTTNINLAAAAAAAAAASMGGSSPRSNVPLMRPSQLCEYHRLLRCSMVELTKRSESAMSGSETRMTPFPEALASPLPPPVDIGDETKPASRSVRTHLGSATGPVTQASVPTAASQSAVGSRSDFERTTHTPGANRSPLVPPQHQLAISLGPDDNHLPPRQQHQQVQQTERLTASSHKPKDAPDNYQSLLMVPNQRQAVPLESRSMSSRTYGELSSSSSVTDSPSSAHRSESHRRHRVLPVEERAIPLSSVSSTNYYAPVVGSRGSGPSFSSVTTSRPSPLNISTLTAPPNSYMRPSPLVAAGAGSSLTSPVPSASSTYRGNPPPSSSFHQFGPGGTGTTLGSATNMSVPTQSLFAASTSGLYSSMSNRYSSFSSSTNPRPPPPKYNNPNDWGEL